MVHPLENQDQDRESVNSFRTVHSTIVLIGHLTKLPGHKINNIPVAPPKCNNFETVDEIGLEDSTSQVFKNLSTLSSYTAILTEVKTKKEKQQYHSTNH